NDVPDHGKATERAKRRRRVQHQVAHPISRARHVIPPVGRSLNITAEKRIDASEMRLLFQATYKCSCVPAARFLRKMRSARHVSRITDTVGQGGGDDRLPSVLPIRLV